MDVIKKLDLETYLREGYFRLSVVIPDSLLSRLRDLFDDLMFGSGAEDLLVKNVKSGGTYINNVEKPCCRGSLAGLETLGFPPVLEIFLSAFRVRTEGLYSERVIESRTEVLGHAIRHYRQLHPEKDPFEWRHPLGSVLLGGGCA